jgi:hypothetical protein
LTTTAERARITDGNGKCDEFAFSRPGYRIIADATVNDARATARQEYLDYITNAWRDPIPRDFFAQKRSRPSHPGHSCAACSYQHRSQ